MNENKDIKETKEIKINRQDEVVADPRKKREIIKTILIIFLAVLLVLTFFSNTIRNKSLSEISTESAVSGKLTERVRGSGMVESNQTYEVTVGGNKVIDTINIKSGQEVQKGDVLFKVASSESADLPAEEASLAALQLEYQKALLAEPADYTAENQAIKNAREDLNSAIAKRDAAAANAGALKAELDQYNSNKSELENKTAIQSKLTATISAIDTDEYAAAAPEYSGDLASLCKDWQNAESEYTNAYALFSQAVSAGVDSSAAKADADAKDAARQAAKSRYEDAKSNQRNQLAAQLDSVSSEINSLNASIAAYEASHSSTDNGSVDDLNAAVTDKQRALEDLIIALNKTKNTDDRTNQISALDLEAKKKEIETQQAKVDKLKAAAEATDVTSKYSGIVSSVSVKPGDTTVDGTPLAVIDISDEGYTVQITVEAEKAKKVKTGTEAEVVNNWSGNVQAVLSEIKNDTTPNSKNRILVFNVTGDVTSGTNIDLSIPCGSGNYDTIVPKSAVYQDKNGYFVLTVRSKSSPLGNRYYAERQNVDVMASDETSSAVQGSINYGDYVITAASKPVKAGDQVRMKDK